MTNQLRGSGRPLPEGVGPLLVARGARSFVQGFLNVAFPIYLLHIGFTTVMVGALFTASAAGSAGMTLGVGILADRWGRKPFLVAFGVVTAVAGAVFLASRSFWALAPVSVLAGVGRGGGGGGGAQGGPFAPAEQALLAEKTGERRRTPLFALNATVGSYAGAAGALLSGLAEWLARPGHELLGYQVLFALTLLGGVAVAAATTVVPERSAPVRHAGRRWLNVRSWRTIGKLSLAGSVNGLGIGFIAGFYPVWFHLRFGAGPALVGDITAAGGLLLGPAFALAARLARRWGEVLTITCTRLAAALALVALPAMPTLAAAAACFLARNVAAMMALPLRQSFALGIVEEGERASAVGLRGVAARLPSAASPLATGYLFNADDLALPFWLAAACQAANAALYFAFFRRADPAGPLREVDGRAAASEGGAPE